MKRFLRCDGEYTASVFVILRSLHFSFLTVTVLFSVSRFNVYFFMLHYILFWILFVNLINFASFTFLFPHLDLYISSCEAGINFFWFIQCFIFLPFFFSGSPLQKHCLCLFLKKYILMSSCYY